MFSASVAYHLPERTSAAYIPLSAGCTPGRVIRPFARRTTGNHLIKDGTVPMSGI